MSVVRALIHFSKFGFTLDPLGFEIRDARPHCVTFQCKLARPPIVDADFVRPCKQMLPCFAEKFFARRRARLQGVKSHALSREFVIVAFVCLIDCGGEPRSFGA